MPNNGAEPMPRLSERWNDERISSLRSSAADIRERAAALGQWRAAFKCALLQLGSQSPSLGAALTDLFVRDARLRGRPAPSGRRGAGDASG